MLRLYNYRVCFGNGGSVHFRNLQRSYSQTWFGSKQVSNKQMLLKPTKTTQYVSAKNMVDHFCWVYIFGAKRKLSCSTKTFSKFTPNNTGENMTNYKQDNIQPIFPSDSGLKDSSENSEWGPFIMSRIHALEESSRFHGYNILRWGISVVFVLFASIYLFRDQLRDNMADEVADVASRSMADENVVLKAHGMTKGVLERLVSEPETITLASDFIKEVLQKDDVRKTAVEFASIVLNHADTQEKIQEITRNTVHTILNNEETKHVLLSFIKGLLDEEQTKEACRQLLVTLTKDAAIQELVTDFFKSVLSAPKFQTEAVMLGREVTNKVVHDRDLQKVTGDALWSAVKYGVTPYWFRGD